MQRLFNHARWDADQVRDALRAREYSWRTPPSQSRRRIFRSVIRVGSEIGSGAERSGAAWPSGLLGSVLVVEPFALALHDRPPDTASLSCPEAGQ
jgi:hypothetical protein